MFMEKIMLTTECHNFLIDNGFVYKTYYTPILFDKYDCVYIHEKSAIVSYNDYIVCHRKYFFETFQYKEITLNNLKQILLNIGIIEEKENKKKSQLDTLSKLMQNMLKKDNMDIQSNKSDDNVLKYYQKEESYDFDNYLIDMGFDYQYTCGMVSLDPGTVHTCKNYKNPDFVITYTIIDRFRDTSSNLDHLRKYLLEIKTDNEIFNILLPKKLNLEDLKNHLLNIFFKKDILNDL